MGNSFWEPRFRVTLRAVNGLDPFTAPEAWAAPRPGLADILLTHETPKGRLKGCDATGRRDGYGSPRLAEFLRRLSPRRHFFGHHHWHYSEAAIPTDLGHDSLSVGLNQVVFETRQAKITPGGFGILRVQGGPEPRFEFGVVEDDWYRNLQYRDVADVM